MGPSSDFHGLPFLREVVLDSGFLSGLASGCLSRDPGSECQSRNLLHR